MGFLDKLNKKAQELNEKAEELSKKADNRYFQKGESFKVTYLGGHPEINKKCKCDLIFKGPKIILKTGMFSKYEYRFNDASIEYKTEEEISKDVTLTRLLLVGLFAFGLKKKRKTKTSYLVLDTGTMKMIFSDKNTQKIIDTFTKFKEYYQGQ